LTIVDAGPVDVGPGDAAAAVVALLGALDCTVAAHDLVVASTVTAIAAYGIAVVALLTASALGDAIAAHFRLASGRTAVTTDRVTRRRIALLTRFEETVSAYRLREAGLAAAIAADGVTIVTLLVGLLDAVTAHLEQACGRAVVVVNDVSIVALLDAFSDAVATVGQ
jgi:hypothetical protein